MFLKFLKDQGMINNNNKILTDSYGRFHSYLRISLIEKCNLRCNYCMPINGVPLKPKKDLMTSEEIFEISKTFVKYGVDKIRLTGGEPLVRKDFEEIIKKISTLKTKISLTTNAVLVDRHISYLKKIKNLSINISLDTLNSEKFKKITFRDHFTKTYQNLLMLVDNNFKVKLNVVLMKGINDDEILDFIQLSIKLGIQIRFIEFMPFDGNSWKKDKLVSQNEILSVVKAHYANHFIEESTDTKNFIARDFKIRKLNASFGIISTVTNPFCDTCNRIRLTADGKLKNCLFSNNEVDLLKSFRSGKLIEPIISGIIDKKMSVRAGMDTFEKFKNPEIHSKNRSMITIGG